MINSSDQPLTWTLDWSGKPRIEDGTFTFALPTGVSFHPPSASSKPQFGEIGYLEPNKEFDFVVTCSPRMLLNIDYGINSDYYFLLRSPWKL